MKELEKKLLTLLKKYELNISMTMFKFFPEPHGHFSFLPTFLKSLFFKDSDCCDDFLYFLKQQYLN